MLKASPKTVVTLQTRVLAGRRKTAQRGQADHGVEHEGAEIGNLGHPGQRFDAQAADGAHRRAHEKSKELSESSWSPVPHPAKYQANNSFSGTVEQGRDEKIPNEWELPSDVLWSVVIMRVSRLNH